MTAESQTYLHNVEKGLAKLPEPDRKEILDEIRNHIYEALQKEQSEKSVLSKLGSPSKLAQSYTTIYDLDVGKFTFKDILGNIAFYFSTGLAGIVIVTALLFIGSASCLLALAAIVYGIADIFVDLPGAMTFGTTTLSGISQLLAAVLSSGLLLAISYFCWKQLKKYIATIASSYQNKRVSK